jgi:hypothetical protein
MVTAGIRNILRQRKPTRAPAETERRPPAEKAEKSAGFPLAEPYADCQDVQPTATSVIEGMRQLRHKIFFPPLKVN